MQILFQLLRKFISAWEHSLLVSSGTFFVKSFMQGAIKSMTKRKSNKARILNTIAFTATVLQKPLNLVEILSKAISKMKLIPKKKLKTVKTFMNFRFISRLLIPMYLTEPIYGYFNNIWANKIFTYSFLVPSTFVLHQQHCHDEIAFC